MGKEEGEGSLSEAVPGAGQKLQVRQLLLLGFCTEVWCCGPECPSTPPPPSSQIEGQMAGSVPKAVRTRKGFEPSLSLVASLTRSRQPHWGRECT